MKKLIIVLFTLVLVSPFVLAQNKNKIPHGWFLDGNKPNEYETGIDNTVLQNGKGSAYLKSKQPKPNEFGTLDQYISAENYIGKRIRLSVFIKSEAVEGWSGLWMRIDGDQKQQLGFDNMQNRAIKGTTDWKKYEVVLDIPEGSKGIGFGVLLGGKGKVWFDNMKMEEVDNTIPVTNMNRANFNSKPVNLDFEE